MDYDLESTEGVRKFRQFMEEAADLVVRYGGSLSGEHGDGQARAELLPKMFGPEIMQAFREFKSLWDPDWKMTRASSSSPIVLTKNLRLGPGYDPWQPATHFNFPTTTAVWPPLPCAASEWASVGAMKVESCVRAFASLATKSTPPAAAPTCSGR